MKARTFKHRSRVIRTAYLRGRYCIFIVTGVTTYVRKHRVSVVERHNSGYTHKWI